MLVRFVEWDRRPKRGLILGAVLEKNCLRVLEYRLAVVLVVDERRSGSARARASTSSIDSNEPTRGIKKDMYSS